MEERSELYTPHKEEERLPEHTRYAAANLPKDAWTAKRGNILVTDDNRKLYECVIEFIDKRLAITGDGRGISVVGPSKSGKSLALSQILRSLIYQERSLEIGEDYSDCQRVDYQELCSLWKSEFSAGLLQTLRESRLLFLDNLYGFLPQSAILSCLEARRDQRRTTLLAFLGRGTSDLAQVWRIYEIFQDVNFTFALDECILAKLKGP